MAHTIDDRAVIFDMDGVLLDSEPLHYQALSRVLTREGYTWTVADNERLLGTTVEDSFRIIDEMVHLRLPREYFLTTYEAEALALLQGPLEPSAGVVSSIDMLAERGLCLAVASSSRRSWIDATLRSLGIAGRFSVVVSGDEVANGKPAPDIYLRAAGLLNMAPEVCTAVEDAPNGLLSARSAGMRVVAVRTPYTKNLDLSQADVVIDSLEELSLVNLGVVK